VPSIWLSAHSCLIVPVRTSKSCPPRSSTDKQMVRQDEIRELEDQLIRLDEEDKDENPLWLQSRKLDDARDGGDRRALIKEIDEKLKEYGTI